MKGFPDLPPIWWAGSIALIYLAEWIVPNVHLQLSGMVVLSRVILIAALAIIGWSAIWFWRKKTPIEPHHAPKRLIVEGPYRLSRNPIYLALVLLTLSSAIGHGSFVGLICTVGLWQILDRRFAAKEEQMLIETFPDEANAYLARTRRWV